MQKYDPTPEQREVLDAFATGAHTVVIARAGTGKTSTAVFLAEANKHLSFAYIAFNKAMADEAAKKMPANVTAKTAHAFAYAVSGRLYRERMKRTERTRLADVAKYLGIYSPLQVGEKRLSPSNLTVIVQDMVKKFCKSADEEISTRHLPALDGVEKDLRPTLAKHLLPYARKAWDDLQKVNGGVLYFTHDHYLKLWQLSKPTMTYTDERGVARPFDVIIFDEAQDANPVIEDVVLRQMQHGSQLFIVGDPAQAIYGWNGAIDAMSKFAARDGVEVRYLSQSFRFGPAVAEAGNEWLRQLNDGGKEVQGLDSIESTVAPLDAPKALLTRTNAGALQAALDCQAKGLAIHLVSGASDIQAFAEGALDLQNRGWSKHKDLGLFKTWSEVQRFVMDEPDGTDLAAMVRIIDTYGAQAVLDVFRKAVREDHADVVISTAHKCKGREWSSVKIHSDFAQKTDKDGNLIPLTSEDIMLRYVAVTRAKKTLDPGPLAALVG